MYEAQKRYYEKNKERINKKRREVARARYKERRRKYGQFPTDPEISIKTHKAMLAGQNVYWRELKTSEEDKLRTFSNYVEALKKYSIGPETDMALLYLMIHTVDQWFDSDYKRRTRSQGTYEQYDGVMERKVYKSAAVWSSKDIQHYVTEYYDDVPAPYVTVVANVIGLQSAKNTMLGGLNMNFRLFLPFRGYVTDETAFENHVLPYYNPNYTKGRPSMFKVMDALVKRLNLARDFAGLKLITDEVYNKVVKDLDRDSVHRFEVLNKINGERDISEML